MKLQDNYTKTDLIEIISKLIEKVERLERRQTERQGERQNDIKIKNNKLSYP